MVVLYDELNLELRTIKRYRARFPDAVDLPRTGKGEGQVSDQHLYTPPVQAEGCLKLHAVDRGLLWANRVTGVYWGIGTL